jgi:hypothetical protein
MNNKEDETVSHCSVEEWEAGSIRVARVVVEIDAHLAGLYHTTTGLTMAGTVPGEAILCASRLTPLPKPDGGLRPIAVGGMICRLATKAIVQHSNRRDFLLPYQFGVGSKGGVEPVVRAVERAVEGTLDRPYTHLTSLDFSNAFNTVDRKDIAEGLRQYAPILYQPGRWAYGCTSSLVLGSPEGRHIINSAQGHHQLGTGRPKGGPDGTAHVLARYTLCTQRSGIYPWPRRTYPGVPRRHLHPQLV